MTNENPNDLLRGSGVPALASPTETAQIPAIMGGRPLPLWSSLPCATPADRARILRETDGDALSADDVIGQVLDVCDLVCHQVDLEGEEDGEVISATRTVLILTDGRRVACCSRGVVSSLAQIMTLYGWPPPGGSIKCELVARRTRKGYRTLKLLPVP